MGEDNLVRINTVASLFAALMAGASVTALSAGSAHAQQDKSSTAVQEVIVTAQKRAQNLQVVPISIKALSGSELAKSGVISTAGLQNYATGLTISSTGSGFTNFIYMRGAGTSQLDAGSDPSVATFVDEVYVTGAAGLQFSLFDVDRVEVLKGPQGTLFGRNAEAGAISITTVRPSSHFGASIDVDGGSYGYFNGHASVTGPINQDGSLRFRLAGAYETRGAFTENLTPGGKDPGTISTGGGRAQLEWVGKDASFLLTAEGLVSRDGMSNLFVSTADSSVDITSAAAAALPCCTSWYKQFYDVNGYENQDLWDVTGRLEWRTPIGQLTSISSYRSNLYQRLQDNDATAANADALLSKERDSSFSQEIRLASDQPGRLHWLGGLYYYYGTIDSDFSPILGPAFPTVPLQNRTVADNSVITTSSYAVFGQLSYDLTDQISLTAGARYSVDRKDDARQFNINPAVSIPVPFPPFSLNPFPDYAIHPNGNWNSIDPSVSLNYKITPSVLAYFSFSTGYKSGGFQSTPALSKTTAQTLFKPEHLRSYELGLKSDWFERRLVVNGAVFHTDIVNQQVLQATAPLVEEVTNAGAARDDGADISITARPTPRLLLTADMTVQRARFVTYQSGAANYAGNPQLRSPDFSGSYSAQYTFPMPGEANLAVRAEYNYRTDVSFDPSNPRTQGTYQPAYGLANLRITYTPRDANWSASLWGRNLGNTRYCGQILVALPTAICAPGEPLTFGGSVHLDLR
jgi:iron complex outermembrane receptor protein